MTETGSRRPFHTFDNRNLLRACRTTLRRRQPRHLAFSFEGRRIVYCPINKNASTAFTAFLMSLLPQGGDTPKRLAGRSARFKMFAEAFPYRFPERNASRDMTVFVYRDPFERIVSFYLNKFVQLSGARSALNSYRQITGCDPETATFHSLVHDYLAHGGHLRDPHTRPQRDHLLPMRYSHAIPIGHLHAAAAEIFSQETADAFFLAPMNKSGAGLARHAIPDADQCPAASLRKTMAEERILPTRDSLLTGDIADTLGRLYARDMPFRQMD